MKYRRFSVCCAVAVLIGGMNLSRAAFADTEPDAGTVTDPALSDTFCDDTSEAELLQEDVEDIEEAPDCDFVSLFPAAATTAVSVYNPELHNTWLDTAVYDTCTYYNGGSVGSAVLLNGTMYVVGKGKATAALKDVADFTHVYAQNEKGVYTHGDLVLKKDGTLLANGKEQKQCGITSLEYGCGSTDNHELYAFIPYTDMFINTFVTDSFSRFLPDQEVPQLFYSMGDGVVAFHVNYSETGAIRATRSNVGIVAPRIVAGDLFVDNLDVLYRLDTEPDIKLNWITNYVKSLECIGEKNGCKLFRYTLTNNRTGEVVSNVKAEDPSVIMRKELSAGSGKTVSCVITRNRQLSGTCSGKQFTVTNVETVLHADTVSGKVCLYFLRTDGSIWMYNFDTKACTELASGSGSGVKGDVNGDGKFNTDDLKLMQNWVGSENSTIANWKCGDLNKDNSLDSTDLALMKRDLMH